LEDTFHAPANGRDIAEGEGRREETYDLLVFREREAMEKFQWIRREIIRVVAFSESFQSRFDARIPLAVLPLFFGAVNAYWLPMTG
jgi:hypothetical protein